MACPIGFRLIGSEMTASDAESGYHSIAFNIMRCTSDGPAPLSLARKASDPKREKQT